MTAPLASNDMQQPVLQPFLQKVFDPDQDIPTAREFYWRDIFPACSPKWRRHTQSDFLAANIFGTMSASIVYATSVKSQSVSRKGQQIVLFAFKKTQLQIMGNIRVKHKRN